MNIRISWTILTVIMLLSICVIADETTDKEIAFIDLFIDSYTFIQGDIINLSSRLYYSDDTPLIGKDVYYTIDDYLVSIKNTDDEGMTYSNVDSRDLSPGSYEVVSSFYGDDGSSPINDTAYIVIQGDYLETLEVIDSVSNNEKRYDQERTISSKVKQVESCVETPYEVNVPVYGKCVSNSTNETESVYDCVVDSLKQIEYTKECKPKKLEINNRFKLDLAEYSCSYNEEYDRVVVTCDSRYDGNGDGICQSGESCLRYEMTDDSYVKYEKNSNREFIQSDSTFFLDRINVEVEE